MSLDFDFEEMKDIIEGRTKKFDCPEMGQPCPVSEQLCKKIHEYHNLWINQRMGDLD